MNRIVKVLIVLNVALAALSVSSSPLHADGFEWWTDCCKVDASHWGFCCDDCCITTSNCKGNSDCRGPILPS